MFLLFWSSSKTLDLNKTNSCIANDKTEPLCYLGWLDSGEVYTFSVVFYYQKLSTSINLLFWSIYQIGPPYGSQGTYWKVHLASNWTVDWEIISAESGNMPDSP